MKGRVEDVFQIDSTSVSCDYSFKADGGKCFFYSRVDLSEALMVSHRGKPDALTQVWESARDCLSCWPYHLL